MLNILITGATGFVGSHLCGHVASAASPIGAANTFAMRRSWRSPMDTFNEFGVGRNVEVVDCDLTDAHATMDVIERCAPDVVFHLAAQSYVPTSYAAPTATAIASTA